MLSATFFCAFVCVCFREDQNGPAQNQPSEYKIWSWKVHMYCRKYGHPKISLKDPLWLENQYEEIIRFFGKLSCFLYLLVEKEVTEVKTEDELTT